LRADPVGRRMLGWAWTRAMNAIGGFNIQDVNCAYKLIHRRVLHRVTIGSDGAFASAELLARASRLGYRFLEVPVGHRIRSSGRQTGAELKVVARALGEAFVGGVRLRRDLPCRAISPSMDIGVSEGRDRS